MTNKQRVGEEIEECILPQPATRTYITRNIAKEITKDILLKLDELGVVIRGESLGGSHPHLSAYYTVESLIEGSK